MKYRDHIRRLTERSAKFIKLIDAFHDAGGILETSKDEYGLLVYDIHTPDGKNTYTITSTEVTNEPINSLNPDDILNVYYQFITIKKDPEQVKIEITQEITHILDKTQDKFVNKVLG